MTMVNWPLLGKPTLVGLAMVTVVDVVELIFVARSARAVKFVSSATPRAVLPPRPPHESVIGLPFLSTSPGPVRASATRWSAGL